MSVGAAAGAADDRAAATIPGVARRLLPATIVFLVALVVLLAQSGALLNDPDSQWHVAVGRWIWTQGAVPKTDPFSQTFAGEPWIAKEWVSQLILYAAFQLGGWRGVTTLAALAIAVSFALLYAWLRRRTRSTVALALTLVAAVLAAPHFLARPHILVLPVIIVWMITLLSALDRRRAPPLAFALLMVAWANMHGSFPLGLIMAGVLAGEGVSAAPPRERLAMARHWGSFLLVIAAAMLVTPYGWDAVRVSVQMSGNAATLSYITEWQPLAFDLQGSIAVALLATLGVAMILQVRAELFRILAAAMLAYLMFRHTRFVSLFAMLAPLLATRAIAACRGLGPEAEGRGLRVLGASASVLFASAAVAFATIRPEPPARMTPDSAYRAAQAAGVAGAVYNDYDFGGYLIAQGVKTFVDGRTDQLFLGSFLPDLKSAVAAQDDGPFQALLARHGVRWALVRTDSDEARHISALPGWYRVYADPIAAVFAADWSRRSRAER